MTTGINNLVWALTSVHRGIDSLNSPLMILCFHDNCGDLSINLPRVYIRSLLKAYNEQKQKLGSQSLFLMCLGKNCKGTFFSLLIIICKIWIPRQPQL